MCDFQEARIDVLENENERLKEKLEIADKALQKIEVLKALNLSDKAKVELSFNLSQDALSKIKDMK